MKAICKYIADGNCDLWPICKFAQIGADEPVQDLPHGPGAAKRLGFSVKGAEKREPAATTHKAGAKDGRAPKFTSLDPKRDDHLKYAFKALNRWAREERLDAAAQTELAYLRHECPLGAKYLIDRDRQRLVALYAAQRAKIVESAKGEAS